MFGSKEGGSSKVWRWGKNEKGKNKGKSKDLSSELPQGEAPFDPFLASLEGIKHNVQKEDLS